MRPYKKRSFHSHLHTNENNMEAENSDDSEKQASSSPPLDDVERDKDKEGETKRRKKWKRKISRKQFRHHSIKLFTPGEHRSTSLLKHKETGPTIPKKTDVGSKESITDSIVTTLGGQKQDSPQKKDQMEESVDSTTKNEAEENNNTNGVQNNNVGKHNLPAIIIETPSLRRRSVDNTNISRSNLKNIDPKLNRRMSVDMPLLNSPEQIPKNHQTQLQMAEHRQEQPSVTKTESRNITESLAHRKNMNRKDCNNVETDGGTSQQKLLNLNNNELVSQYNAIEQSRLMQNSRYNGHVEKIHSAERLSAQNPMETSSDELLVEPENLSLKRRHSGETPVDLSRRSAEPIDERPKPYYPTSHQNIHTQRTNVESSKSTENSYSSVNYHHQTDDNAATVRTSSQPNKNQSTSSKESEPRDQDREILADAVAKIANLNRWQEVLQRLLKQSFTLQILDMMAHAYEQIDQAQNEICIHPELKFKAQKLLSEAYSFISLKLKMLNLDVNPIFVIKILGQPDNTPEKNTLRHYMENIERIRTLAINEGVSAVNKIPVAQLSLPSTYLQNYRELTRTRSSPPAPYFPHINSSQYQRNSRKSHLPSGPSFQANNHSSPLGHQIVQPSRTGGTNLPPGYLNISSPKTDNHPLSGGHSRETSPRTGDHPVPTELSPRQFRRPSPQNSDHSVPSGLSQRSTEYPSSQFLSRGPSPKTVNHSMPFGYHGGQSTRTGEYPAPERNVRGPSPRTGDTPLKHDYPSGVYLRTGGDLMQQGIAQNPSARSGVPLEYTREQLGSNTHSMPTGFPERPLVRPCNNSIPLNYPRDLQFQHPSAYNNTPYHNYNNTNNLNKFTPQVSHKEPANRPSGAVGRPRSKSHKNNNTGGRSEHPQHLRRSLSNPQHPAIENPLPTPPFLKETTSRMPPPRMPASTHNDHHPNNDRPIPNLVQNNEPSLTSSSAARSKPPVPPIYSEVFYQNLHNHVTKGNPLAISVHPQPVTYQKNIASAEGNEGRKEMNNVRNVHRKVPDEHIELQKDTSKQLFTNPVEEKISTLTDRLEISKVTNVLQQSKYKKVSLHDPASPKPTEPLKSIPVAVIVADKSMQITKERTTTSDKEASIDLAEKSDTRISVSSNSNENISSSEENLRQAFDKEQEENNTEFLVWLEKLKSNEKLKSRFLSQMGIIKKEEPLFMSESDPIEIVDSDEENASESQKSDEQRALDLPKSTSKSHLEEETIKIQTSANVNDNYVSYEIPLKASSSTMTSDTMEVDKISSAPKISEVIKNSSPKASLSKNDYIPPIPLPYVPNSNGPHHSPTSIEKSKKTIYSPEIEPISPVGNEASFVFPDVLSSSKIPPPLSDKTKVFSDTVTSPTYHKRKSPLEIPAYQSEKSTSAKTDYPNDNSVKRRKSLERPEMTRSPKTPPSGKLCYVRESHMFLRYFDDTQVELFIRNLSTQDEELLRSTEIEQERFKNTHQLSKFGSDHLAKTEIIHLPREVEFSEKEDIPEVEEFIKETSLVEQFVPKDFADFYRYVTGFQIIKNKHPVSLQTFLTMYNTNRTSELLRKYLERDEVVSRRR